LDAAESAIAVFGMPARLDRRDGGCGGEEQLGVHGHQHWSADSIDDADDVGKYSKQRSNGSGLDEFRKQVRKSASGIID
jgi:hypothetical protein